MKPVGGLKILNQQPYITISHEDLCAIQHIVAIAPKEAQWWHEVERIEEEGFITYNLTNMYIPEQYCSMAEVDTDPMMMVAFYKELKEKHGAEEANNILMKMTCWCHSHHNMAPNPSGQDQKQFIEQCEAASNQNIEAPQVMMIFNKKDDYYCRIWDPKINLLVENVDIIVGNYDFDWIHEEAKKKFKEKKIKKIATRRKTGTPGLIDFDQLSLSYSDFNSPVKGGVKKNILKDRKPGNVPKPSTAELKKLESEHEDLEQMLESVEKVEDYHTIEEVVKRTREILTPTQFAYLSLLISSDEENVWELENKIVIPTDDLLEDAILTIHNALTDAIDSSQYLDACKTAILLSYAQDPETAEEVLDLYVTNHLYEFDFNNNYYDEINRQDEHIRSIIREEF